MIGLNPWLILHNSLELALTNWKTFTGISTNEVNCADIDDAAAAFVAELEKLAGD